MTRKPRTTRSTSPSPTAPTWRRPTADRYTGNVQDRDEFADARSEGLDMLVGVVKVMLALAIVIALAGIANTMSLSIHERRREIGLLRAVGQTRRQLRRSLRVELMLVALYGTTVGVIVGAVCGAIVFEATFGDGHIAVPRLTLGVLIVVGVVAGRIAAWRPARRAARQPILTALGSTT